jgi:hypothetical protein
LSIMTSSLGCKTKTNRENGPTQLLILGGMSCRLNCQSLTTQEMIMEPPFHCGDARIVINSRLSRSLDGGTGQIFTQSRMFGISSHGVKSAVEIRLLGRYWRRR